MAPLPISARSRSLQSSSASRCACVDGPAARQRRRSHARTAATSAQPEARVGAPGPTLTDHPPSRSTAAKPYSSVRSSPTNTGRRPANGASAMKSWIAVPLSRPSGLTSSSILPGCRRIAASTSCAATCAQRAMDVRRELRRARGSAARATRPCPRAAARVALGELGEQLAQPRVASPSRRVQVDACPSASRRSQPCWPAIGSCSPGKSGRRSVIARPGDQRERAAERRAERAAAARRASWSMSHGVGRRARARASVPSISRNSAQSCASGGGRRPDEARRTRGAELVAHRAAQARRAPRPARRSACAGASPRRRAACGRPSGRR